MRGANAGRAELMMLGFDGDSLAIDANNAPAHDEFQRADALQQEWPVDGQLDDAGGRKSVDAFKADTPAADIQSLT